MTVSAKREVDIDECGILVRIRCPLCLSTVGKDFLLKEFLDVAIVEGEVYCERCDKWLDIRSEIIISVLIPKV